MGPRDNSSPQLLYRGSVKDLWGPFRSRLDSAVVFEYTDAYSVFDWGRMPDLLKHKGEALALIAASWFERLELSETWRKYSQTSEAATFLQANRFGRGFVDVGRSLSSEGLRTHYLGVLNEIPSGQDIMPIAVAQARGPIRHLVVKQVSVLKPKVTKILGREVPDYLVNRVSPLPRLIPLEFVFRFSCPEGSSLLGRVKKDPGYLASLGYAGVELKPGVCWDFPVLELFTKLETADRPLTLTEALAISGISAKQLERVLFKTAWVAGWLRSVCMQAGLELADGKLEWAMASEGEEDECILIDAIGPDELRILKSGLQLSKEFLRIHYRKTAWYFSVQKAKEEADFKGVVDWKHDVEMDPPRLPLEHCELTSHLYQALANELTGFRFFPTAWSLDQFVRKAQEVFGRNSE